MVPEAKFGDDLDADSLDLVELVMALEEEFGVEVPEEELEGSRPSARPTTWSSASSDARACAAVGVVAITGYGVVAPCGIGKEAFWAGPARPGHHRRPQPSRSPTGIRSPYFDNPKEARRADRVEQFALAAAAEASSRPAARRADASRIRHDLRHRRRRPAHPRGAGRGPASRRASGGCRRSSCR